MAVNDLARPVTQPEEQLYYARLLDWGTHLGLAVLVLTFGLYVFGLARPGVPLEDLPRLWSQPLATYLAQTQAPTGWAWLAHWRRGDAASLLGIVILAGTSVTCLLAVVPLYWRRRDRTFVALALAEVAVVILAASGVLNAGH